MSVLEVISTSALIAALVSAVIGLWRDRKLEKFKDELRTEAFQRETRFASLHQRRAEIVAELYRLLVVAHERIVTASMPRIAVPRIIGEPPEQDTLGRQAFEAYWQFESYGNRNRLYLTKEQAGMMDEIAALMRSASLLASFLRSEGISEEFKTKRKGELALSMENLAEAKESLEESFREMLGAEPES